MQNNIPCKKRNYRSLSNKINYPVDIFKEEGGQIRFMSDVECVQKYGILNCEEFISLKEVIRQGAQRLGIDLMKQTVNAPYRPAILKLINISEKGCNLWAKIFKRKFMSNATLIKKETNWENSLENRQGIFFWDKCYLNASKIFFDYKL